MPSPKLLIFIFLLSLSLDCSAQLDSIWTKTGLVACTVKEVNPETIKFILPNEQIHQAIYRTDVLQIKYSSGRDQTFVKKLRLKKVKDATQFDSVGITRLEYDVKGLIRVDTLAFSLPLNSKAENFGKSRKIREKAYRSMQQEAAMNGFNAIWLTDPGTDNVSQKPGMNKEVTLSFTGIVFTDTLPQAETFLQRIGTKKTYNSYQKITLRRDGSFQEKIGLVVKVDVTDVKVENGIIFIQTKINTLDGTTFRVVSYDKLAFTLASSDAKNIYNVKVFF